jgi:hypothetical protein
VLSAICERLIMEQNTKMLEQIKSELVSLTAPKKDSHTFAEVQQAIRDERTTIFLQKLQTTLLEQKEDLLNDDTGSVSSDATLTIQCSSCSDDDIFVCKDFVWQGVDYIMQDTTVFNDKVEPIGTWDGTSVVFSCQDARNYHEEHKVIFSFPDTEFKIAWKHPGKKAQTIVIRPDGSCSSGSSWYSVGHQGDFRWICGYNYYMRATTPGEWVCDLDKSTGYSGKLKTIRHASIIE